MAHSGDDVNWGYQLEALPPWMRGAIVWFRLAGTVAIMVILVGVYVGKDLGLVDDRASTDRKELRQEALKHSRILEENQKYLMVQQELEKQGQAIQRENVDNTKAIARNLCLLIPNLSKRDQQDCMNGVR